MQAPVKLDQSRLLGFKLQQKSPGSALYGIGAKIGTKFGIVKPTVTCVL